MTRQPTTGDRTDRTNLSDPRLTRADTPLGRVLFERNLSYERAAAQIRAHFAAANPAEPPLRLSGSYLAKVTRGEWEPRLKVARAIVAWAGSTVALGDLVTLT